MRRRINIYTYVLVILAAAGISMSFQELRSATAIEASHNPEAGTEKPVKGKKKREKGGQAP